MTSETEMKKEHDELAKEIKSIRETIAVHEARLNMRAKGIGEELDIRAALQSIEDRLNYLEVFLDIQT